MPKFDLKIKFPCGLEIEEHIEGIFLESVNDWKDIKECPLHGKNCKKSK